MRHRKGFNHLGRKSEHRKAMLANMAGSLIMYKRIKTTKAKAKALRTYIEPLITRSKEDTTHSRRVVFSYLKDKRAVAELFREVSPKVAERPGGYTRILKLGNRPGDNADMCIIELVDFNELLLESTQKAKVKTTRRGRRGRKKSVAAVGQASAETTTEDTVDDVIPETPVAEAQETGETEVVAKETSTEIPQAAEKIKVEEDTPKKESVAGKEEKEAEEKQETKAGKTPEETKSEDKEEAGEGNKEERGK